jgi:protein SDA1
VSKAEKLSKIIAGRTEFESKQRSGGSTNIEKKRKKNFVMSKFGRETRAKGRGKAGLNEKTFGGKKQIGHEKKKRRRKM